MHKLVTAPDRDAVDRGLVDHSQQCVLRGLADFGQCALARVRRVEATRAKARPEPRHGPVSRRTLVGIGFEGGPLPFSVQAFVRNAFLDNRGAQSAPIGPLGTECFAQRFQMLAPSMAGVTHQRRSTSVLSIADRAALAAYCQAWGRWVEAEEKLKTTPPMLRTPNGHVQQSPWMSVANKQLELVGRFMAELGLTPAARSRIGS